MRRVLLESPLEWATIALLVVVLGVAVPRALWTWQGIERQERRNVDARIAVLAALQEHEALRRKERDLDARIVDLSRHLDRGTCWTCGWPYWEVP